MKNKILYIFIMATLILGTSIGYFYHAYQYRIEIEAGNNWKATQYLDSISYPDLTDRVKIACNFGNKQTFDARDTDLKFTQKDFGVDGKFIGHDKNFLIQKVCEMSKSEIDGIVEQVANGEDAPTLFTVTLTN